jgi:hypothetical protein
VHTAFWWGDQLQDPGIDGRIILRWISEKRDAGHRGRWWAFVNAVINRQVL